ncbi:MAG: hypothetical protein IJV00_03045, partial [Clostridia bacterium]|nr:hypothetical protein [Clostridia bacterium]
LKENCHPEHPMIPYYATQIKRLEEWIKLYSLENVYPDARGFLRASINAAAGQRRESIDPVRANPDICGYSMTSFTVSNEGVYSSRGQLVPGVVDALRDSFAPLKWSVFTPSNVFYPGKPIEAEIVLCSEDVLPAGEYEATVSVTGAGGVSFREKQSFRYPDGSPLAATVMNVTVPGLTPGDYTLSVDADGSYRPTCGKKKLFVRDPDAAPRLKGSLFTIGDAKKAEEVLLSHGMTKASRADEADLIAVGVTGQDEETKKKIFSLASCGKKVFILDSGFWEKSNTSEQKFMQSIEYGAQNAASVFGECVYVRNWLYHLDSYAADSKAFEGLTDVGIIDMELFREVYPDHYLINTSKPEKTFCASFGSGIFAKDGCMAALTAGRFSFGKGSVTVSTFKILENVGLDPAADILLLNLFAAD